MTVQHTPAPWEVGIGRIYKDGKPIESEYFVRREDDDTAIASDIVNPDTGGTDEVARANAQLMAAAPDLLEALQALTKEPLGDFIYDVRESEQLGWDGPRVKNWARGVDKATQAITKATGSQA
jgi:hypothetical protein